MICLQDKVIDLFKLRNLLKIKQILIDLRLSLQSLIPQMPQKILMLRKLQKWLNEQSLLIEIIVLKNSRNILMIVLFKATFSLYSILSPHSFITLPISPFESPKSLSFSLNHWSDIDRAIFVDRPALAIHLAFLPGALVLGFELKTVIMDSINLDTKAMSDLCEILFDFLPVFVKIWL